MKKRLLNWENSYTDKDSDLTQKSKLKKREKPDSKIRLLFSFRLNFCHNISNNRIKDIHSRISKAKFSTFLIIKDKALLLIRENFFLIIWHENRVEMLDIVNSFISSQAEKKRFNQIVLTPHHFKGFWIEILTFCILLKANGIFESQSFSIEIRESKRSQQFRI